MTRQPERDAQIIALCDQGLTQGQIVNVFAARLDWPQITRSTVAGVVSRAGKDLNKTGRIRSKVEKLPPIPKQRFIMNGPSKPPQPHKLDKLEDEPKPIGPIGEFPDDGACLYLKGNLHPEYQMCGHPTRRGKSYCDWHFDNHIKRKV